MCSDAGISCCNILSSMLSCHTGKRKFSACCPALRQGGYSHRSHMRGGGANGYLWGIISSSDVSGCICQSDSSDKQKKMTAHPTKITVIFMIWIEGITAYRQHALFLFSVYPDFMHLSIPVCGFPYKAVYCKTTANPSCGAAVGGIFYGIFYTSSHCESMPFHV